MLKSWETYELTESGEFFKKSHEGGTGFPEEIKTKLWNRKTKQKLKTKN